MIEATLLTKKLQDSGKDTSESDLAIDTVAFHLEAANYHLAVLKRLFENGMPLYNQNPRGHKKFRYHTMALFFELMASFDCFLQVINLLYLLCLKERKVTWKSINYHVRKQGREDTFIDFLRKEYNQEWFSAFRNYRNILAHRGKVVFYIVTRRNLGLPSVYHLLDVKKGTYFAKPAPEQCQEFYDQMEQLIKRGFGMLTESAPVFQQ